ncbi:MAG TPA: M23 family metallopeptidase [Bacteroidetes bacterium]|nr:M23 family metallopeptidase [Bacteroidota bacterium]
MGKIKYYYNAQTLSYEKISPSFGKRLLRVFGFIMASLFTAIGIIIIAFMYIDSPKEKKLYSQINDLEAQYSYLNNELEKMTTVLKDLQQRDDNIYRVITESEPIPSSIRELGTGGSKRFEEFEKYADLGDLVVNTSEKLKKIQKQLYIQSKSYDELAQLINNKEKYWASRPAIQPISNKDLTRLASGYGWRIDPIYKTRKFHEGIDFTAPRGTPVHATGDGVVIRIQYLRTGYGKNIIIDHGFGYSSLYAHLSNVSVKRGQKIKRGQIIGKVGSSGKSTAPHLHYEVIKGKRKVNPIEFFYSDLNPEEYELMIKFASQSNQSFD